MTDDIRYERLILLMDDDKLEKFSRKWVEKKSGYVEVKRYSGSGDLGRDVVGFLSDQRSEGPWDCYQCKQYLRRLNRSQGLLAIGKVLYWASQGKFTTPKNFFFVAPKGVERSFELLIDKPSELKKALIEKWDAVCSKSITDTKKTPLDDALKAFIDKWEFKSVRVLNLDDMMNDPAVKPLLVDEFGADPGKYPDAVVPLQVQDTETRYVEELVFAYGERAKKTFPDHEAVLADDDHGSDFRLQRERFFEADAFQKFYRDNTAPAIIAAFRKDVRFGVAERWKALVPDTLARIESVMEQAGMVNPAGPLAQYGHVPVKQGMCHHFVNDGELSWKKKP